tara:strand:- start:673 stop:1266 length:594 start_codon:yes stop_codon:yes gene_type:complete
MLKLEHYKLFHNSQDFETLFKKSIPSLRDLYVNEVDFYQSVVKKAIEKKTLFIYYKDNTPIGFVVFSAKFKTAFWDFDFIINQKKYRKYIRIFRTSVLNKIREKAEELGFIILKKNIKSLNSMFKLPKYTKIKINKKTCKMNGVSAFRFTMDLKQLDNMKQCDSLLGYEARTCLHFGTFAPEIAGTKIPDDDSGSVQ